MTDEKGVSPIVAAVILLAVTVVAAIGIATYIRGMALGVTAPRVDLNVRLYDNCPLKENDYFIIEHAGGDTFSLDDCDTWIMWVGNPGTSHLFDPTKVTGLKGTIAAGDTKTIRVENTYGIDSGSLYAFWIFHRPSGVRIFDSGPEGIVGERAP